MMIVNEEMNTISEEQILHNKLSFEINQELIHLMKRIVELQQENALLKEFKKEHDIMKKILIEQGLWETLLNDDRFLEHLREEN